MKDLEEKENLIKRARLMVEIKYIEKVIVEAGKFGYYDVVHSLNKLSLSKSCKLTNMIQLENNKGLNEI